MAEPTAAELGPLLASSEPLTEETPDPYGDEDSAFMSAAKVAVGGDSQAVALKDAIEACLRSHGLLGSADEPISDESEDSDVGAGFEDL